MRHFFYLSSEFILSTFSVFLFFFFVVLFFLVFFWVFFPFFDISSNSLQHCYLFLSTLFWLFLKGEMYIYTCFFVFFKLHLKTALFQRILYFWRLANVPKNTQMFFPEWLIKKKMSIIATNMSANSQLCPKVKRSFFKKSTHKKQINVLVLSWSYFKGKQQTGKKRLI